MPTISIRVEDDLRSDLEEAANADGLSVSEYIRQAAEMRLGRDVDREWAAPVSLSRRDRLQLAMLHELARNLTGDEDVAARHQRMVDVLHHGFAGDYSEVFVSLDDELSRSDCSLVWDILDMFRVLKASVAEVGLETVMALDDNAEHALTFRGFDLNDRREGKMLIYVRHLLANERWTELAEDVETGSDGGNSHSPRLPTYQRMLSAFRPIWSDVVQGRSRGRRGFRLTAEELAEVVRAWPYPR